MLLFADAASNAYWLSIVYGLKDRNLKNLLVFSQKIEDLTIFFISSLRTEGKEAKTALPGLDRPRLQRQGMSGFISPKWAVKLRMDSRIFSDSKWGIWCLIEVAVGDWPLQPDCLQDLQTKEKNGWVHFHGAAISFLPSFWLYFNERIYEYGDKVKVMISWKSVDFKPQFWWKSV